MEFLFTIILAVITVVNYLLYRNVMAPAVLFGIVWTASLGLHALFSVTLLEGLFQVSLPVLLLFTGGLAAFSAGSWLCNMYMKPGENAPLLPARTLSQHYAPFSFLMRMVLILVCIVVMPFFIQKAIELFVKSQAENFFVGLRTELTYGDEGLGPLKYIVNFSTFVFAICQLEALRFPTVRNKVIGFTSFLLAVIYALFFTGRVFFIMMLALYLGIQVLYNPRFSIKKFLWIVPAGIILFTVYGLVYGKGGSFEDSFASNLKSSSQNTALYFSGSLSALDWELTHHFNVAYNGHNSLRFFYVAAAAFGLTGPVKFDDNLVQDFVFVPYETNVYTVYSPYVRDFGYLYPCFILFLVGLLHTWLFIRARRTGSPRFVLYYSVLLYPLIMSFFQDQYFSLLSTWLQSILIIEAVFFFNKLFVRKHVLARPQLT